MTYREANRRRIRGNKKWNKVLGFCAAARYEVGNKVSNYCPPPEDRIAERTNELRKKSCEWIWIDTCCIDKDSSAEVSEPINSMCSWYAQSEFCLAYLSDVGTTPEVYKPMGGQFMDSVWFRRGWTLQELLAPGCVIFLSWDWKPLGHKCSRSPPLFSGHCRGCQINVMHLNNLICAATGICDNVIASLHRYTSASVDDQMSWMRNRKTTKPEDMSYCLLGIFDVHMPLIYGEGAENARKRLQEEITKKGKTTKYRLPIMKPGTYRQTTEHPTYASAQRPARQSAPTNDARYKYPTRDAFHLAQFLGLEHPPYFKWNGGPDWTMMWDPISQRNYYYNKTNNTTQWDEQFEL